MNRLPARPTPYARRAADRGATAVFMAIIAPLLIVLAGVVVDGGHLILERRRAQAVADSAALGGTLYIDEDAFATSWDRGGLQQLKLKDDAGRQRANDLVGLYRQGDSFRAVTLSSLTIDTNGLKATAVTQAYVPFYFMPIIDLFGSTVTARAQSQLVYGIDRAGQ
jgi:uncharacterized membrane protein